MGLPLQNPASWHRPHPPHPTFHLKHTPIHIHILSISHSGCHCLSGGGRRDSMCHCVCVYVCVCVCVCVCVVRGNGVGLVEDGRISHLWFVCVKGTYYTCLLET